MSNFNQFKPYSFLRPYSGTPKAHAHIPLSGGSPINPNVLNDQASRSQLLDDLSGNYVALSDVVKALYTINKPPQLRQIAYVQLLTTNNEPTLLIPGNKRRMSFLISNSNADNVDLFWFYDRPADLIPGIFLGSGETYQEANGMVSIDDIWVITDNAPAYAIGYEGTLAIESDQFQGTQS